MESDLDMEYMTAMAPNVSVYFDGNSGETTFSEWAETLPSKFDPLPHVISISYGASEAEISSQELDRFETAVQKLGSSFV